MARKIISILGLCALSLVVTTETYASVGISPAAIEARLGREAVEDRTLSITRDSEDTPYDMYVSVFSEDGFLITEGKTYFMEKGQSELIVPYRISSESYAPGTYTGVLYIRPQRVEQIMAGNVQFIVQGGVRAKLQVLDEAPATTTFKERVVARAQAHISIYIDTFHELIDDGVGMAANLLGL